MDVQIKPGDHWRRIKPEQAKKMSRSREQEPKGLNDSDIAGLLEEESGEEESVRE